MQTTYDEVPYLGRVHVQTHPQHIYTIAQLFQFPAVHFKNARILELGCGDGSNLINIAYQLPEATCFGIDHSKVHIERGQSICNEAKIKNCILEHVDIQKFTPPHEFDYIICHGVYSWVSPNLQNKILEIFENSLSPNGIAYISYNTLPGWHQFQVFRGMMKYHASKMTTTQDKIEQSKAIVHFVTEHVLKPDAPYGFLLQQNVDFITNLQDDYLFHEFLENHNEALYFHQFIDRIQQYPLQYLGDTSFHSMIHHNMTHDTREVLDSISGSIYELEQYMDFLNCRSFRGSLLVKDHHNITRTINRSIFKNFYYAFDQIPQIRKASDNQDEYTDKDIEEQEDVSYEYEYISDEHEEISPDYEDISDEHEEIVDEQEDISDGYEDNEEYKIFNDNIIWHDENFDNNHQLQEDFDIRDIPITFPTDIDEQTQELLFQCFEMIYKKHPQMHSFSEIVEYLEIHHHIKISEEQEEILLDFLQQLFLKKLLSIDSFRPHFVLHISQRPEITPIARSQIAYQSIVNTQLHDMIHVKDPWLKALIPLVDGGSTCEEIADLLLEKERLGELESFVMERIDDEDSENSVEQRLLSPEERRFLLISRLQAAFDYFAKHGILIS